MAIRTDSRSHRMFSGIPILLAALLAGGCASKENGAAKLPPASGEGAPPRAALPALSQPSQDKPADSPTGRTTTGTTYPRASAQVAATMSGVLAQVAVEEGDRVKKGDLLFRLRAQDYDLRVQQAQGALKSTEVGLAGLKVEYDRTQRLFEKNAVNQAAWDQIKSQYESMQVGVEQARVGLAMAQKARGDATVRSPIDGVITQKLKSDGEMVTSMPPSPVVVVEDHSVLELRFRLPERSLTALKAGDKVQAEFTSVGLTREALVVRISPNVDAATRTIEVIAEIPNKDGLLKAGMLAELEIGATPAPAPTAPETAAAKPAEGAPEKQEATP
jgi:RND family efflux transporter MFP subunit